jgi:hypothetical protein
MAHLRFLDFPITIRQQIYTELLIPIFDRDAEGKFAHDITNTSILFVNRQIYAESSDVFYAQNLFAVISSNTDENVAEITREKTPIFVYVENPSKVAQCPRFAMSMEIFNLTQKAPVRSTPKYVITAQMLPLFLTALIGECRFVSSNGQVAQIQTHETFRYTIPKFSELVFGRLLSANRFPKFCALRIEGSIQPSHQRALMEKCTMIEDHACAYFTLALLCYKNRVRYRMACENEPDSKGIKEEIPEHQILALPKLMLRMSDIFMDCHLYHIREFEHPCESGQESLFLGVMDLYNLLVLGYLLAAKRDPKRASDTYLAARQAIEIGISYLNRDDSFVFHNVENARSARSFRNAKAKVSLNASKICKKLGDRQAAVAYMNDAGDYIGMCSVRDKLLKMTWYNWPDLPPESHLIRPAVLWRVAMISTDGLPIIYDEI